MGRMLEATWPMAWLPLSVHLQHVTSLCCFQLALNLISVHQAHGQHQALTQVDIIQISAQISWRLCTSELALLQRTFNS